MAFRKRFFVRFNPNSQQLESAVVDSKHPLHGLGWTEVFVDKCCNDLSLGCSEAARTFVSATAVNPAHTSFTVTIEKGGELMMTSNNADLDAVILSLNNAFGGTVVFSVLADNTIQAITSICGDFEVTASSVA
jgi:hypothetical protein